MNPRHNHTLLRCGECGRFKYLDFQICGMARVKTSMSLDIEIWKKAKIKCIEENLELAAYVEQLLAQDLRLAKPERKKEEARVVEKAKPETKGKGVTTRKPQPTAKELGIGVFGKA